MELQMKERCEKGLQHWGESALETNDIGTNNFGMNAMDLQHATTHGVLKNSLCNNSNFELCTNTLVTFEKKECIHYWTYYKKIVYGLSHQWWGVFVEYTKVGIGLWWILEWDALNILKYHNIFYCCIIIVAEGFPNESFKQCSQFETLLVKSFRQLTFWFWIQPCKQ